MLQHQRVKSDQSEYKTVHLSSNVTNLISYPGNIHDMRMYISIFFLSVWFDTTKTEESLMNNEICSMLICTCLCQDKILKVGKEK